MPRLAFATCDKYPDLVADDRLAIPHLERMGHSVSSAVWDDASVDWSAFDAVVVRSCWDYHLKTAAFIDWIGALEGRGVRLFNSASTLRWNFQKTYLRELEARGTAIPATLWIDAGARIELGDLLVAHGFDHAVVKPVVSLSGTDTWRTSIAKAPSQRAEWEALVATRAVVVQAFVPEIETHGELSLCFFGDRFSHAFRKLPMAGEFRVQEEHGGTHTRMEPAPSLVQRAARILAQAPELPVYARVDVVEVGDAIVLMEIELIDPLLRLDAFEPAAALFAREIDARLE